MRAGLMLGGPGLRQGKIGVVTCDEVDAGCCRHRVHSATSTTTSGSSLLSITTIPCLLATNVVSKTLLSRPGAARSHTRWHAAMLRLVRLPRRPPSRLAPTRLPLPPSRHVHLQTRPLSFSTVPRIMARAFRIPLYGAAVGAGGVGYLNYKFEGASRCAVLRASVLVQLGRIGRIGRTG